MRAVLVLLMLIVAGDASAQVPDPHLQECPAGDDFCPQNQARFKEAYAKAWRRDYTGQRNVAYMLEGRGSFSAGVRADPVAACAWRAVVANSRHKSVDDSERFNLEFACKRLNNAQRLQASLMGADIMSKIYGRGYNTGFRLPE